MTNHFFTKKQVKYNILLKQLQNLPFFYIVFSQIQRKNYLKLSNVFFIANKEFKNLNKQVLKTSSYITDTPLKEDIIILLIKKNHSFFSDQIEIINTNKTIFYFTQNIFLFKRFYLLLKLSSLEKL